MPSGVSTHLIHLKMRESSLEACQIHVEVNYGGLGTRSELFPSSGAFDRRVGGSQPVRIIIHHAAINKINGNTNNDILSSRIPKLT